jgi:integrase/recombinase XerC
VSDVDLDTDSVMLTGKGGKQRRVRFGVKTAGALRRYVRARGRLPGLADIDQLWIAAKGGRPLNPNGIKIRLRELGDRAGVEHLHAQRWRHSFAHEWKLSGGDTGDLMLLMGWSSEEMPRRYGASAAAERAQTVHASSESASAFKAPMSHSDSARYLTVPVGQGVAPRRTAPNGRLSLPAAESHTS